MARLLVLNVKNSERDHVYVAECKGIDDYYKHLECDCFDIANRKVGNKRFDIFCDDVGLYDENPIVSAISSSQEPMLVGNLIFANHDSEGNTVGLSDEDIDEIMSNLFMAVGIRHDGNIDANVVVKADY